MKERPILFSAPMVRALLAGTKTQTRRVVKPVGRDDAFVLVDYGNGFWPYRSDDGESSIRADGNETPFACPYGVPGDRLWVREAFSGHHDWEGRPPRDWHGVENDPIWYWADGNPGAGDWTRPKPSIHMPRRLSRITLEVTEVRVERLQDISARDAWAEGIPYSPDVNPLHEYRDLWESINGAGSWDANPWVWAVSFKVLPR